MAGLEYPRDLHGFGGRPPKVTWPGGNKVAVSLVLNFEEGGENCLLHGDEASEAFLSEIVGAAAWPGQRHWNMESLYEYGARAGFWRIYELMQDLPVTVYGVATALARAPAQVRAMLDADWEIASHGYKWIEYKDFAPEDEAQHVAAAVRLHREVTGKPPVGWYTGRASMNSVTLVAQATELKYISDSYADDLPYWILLGDKPQLLLPYTLDANDMRFATPQGFNSGDQFFTYLKDSLDCLLEEGRQGFGKMLSLGLHCRLIGRPGRVQALKRFIDYAKAQPGIWFATRAQIADFWAEAHPYTPPKLDLCALTEAEFCALLQPFFKDIGGFAKRTRALEKGPAHNSVEGLRSLVLRSIRGGDQDERTALLVARGIVPEGQDAPTPRDIQALEDQVLAFAQSIFRGTN